jgi:hypothetical protein
MIRTRALFDLHLPRAGPGDVARWLRTADAVDVVGALLLLTALVLATYVAVAVLLNMLAVVLRSPMISVTARAVTPHAMRRLTLGALGATVTTGALVTAPAASAPNDVTALTPAGGEDDGDEGTATMRVIEEDASSAPLGPETVIVSPADSFWSLAEEALAHEWRRPPAEAEIATYWLEMIDVNRDRLVVPDDPNLIFPGQELIVPPVPPPP